MKTPIKLYLLLHYYIVYLSIFIFIVVEGFTRISALRWWIHCTHCLKSSRSDVNLSSLRELNLSRVAALIIEKLVTRSQSSVREYTM